MSSPDAVDPAEAIAAALARIRGRRGHRGGPHPGHDRAHRGAPHRNGNSPDAAPAPAPEPTSAPGPRFGAAAAMRMLEALVTAPTPLTVSELGETIGVDQPRASRLVQ